VIRWNRGGEGGGEPISFDANEVRVARLAAEERNTYDLDVGRRPAHGASGDPAEALQINVVGSTGEQAQAKVCGLGRYWSPRVGELDYEGDLGEGVQVRATALPYGCLIVYDTDSDDHVFYLVTGAPPELRARGWLFGYEAKLPRYWRSDVRSPAYFVPALYLHPGRHPGWTPDYRGW
jgi:hypothetical protein